MSRSQANIVIALLAALLLVGIHHAYLQGPRAPHYQYKLILSEKIEPTQLEAAGEDGYDCATPLPVSGDGGKPTGFVDLCKRPR